MEERALISRGEMSLSETMTLGETLAKSGFFSDARQAAQAVVKILAGRELGFGPIAAMTGINVIQGKIALGANLMAASIKRDPRYDYKVNELTDDGCSLSFFENGQKVGDSTFTMQNARETLYWNAKKNVMEPLAEKFNWKSYPRNMCFARALSNGYRWYCPDAGGGTLVYTPDELGAIVDSEGEVIGVPTSAPTPAPSRPPDVDHEADAAEARREILGLEGVDLSYVPDWLDDKETRPDMWWGKFYHEAVEHLAFANDFHVQGALASVHNVDKWVPGGIETNYRTSWHLLQQHQRNKQEQAAEPAE